MADKDKPAILEVARKFQEMGFQIKATNGTQHFCGNGVKCERTYKVHEMQRPNIDDEIKSKSIASSSTPPWARAATGRCLCAQVLHQIQSAVYHHSRGRRRRLVGISEYRNGKAGVKSLQEYHKDIR